MWSPFYLENTMHNRMQKLKRCTAGLLLVVVLATQPAHADEIDAISAAQTVVQVMLVVLVAKWLWNQVKR